MHATVHRYHRRSIRLRHHDYRALGAYFVTICSHSHLPIFGNVNSGRMRLSSAGKLVSDCWREIPHHFPNVSLDEFIVMPDHMHGIVVIRSAPPGKAVPRRFGGSVKDSLSTIVGVFKSYATKHVIAETGIRRVWQRNYYESVIRDDHHMNAVRNYIISNPRKWCTHAHRNT